MKHYWANFPIYLSYMYFPLLSLLLKVMGTSINYDVIWVVVFFLFCIARKRKIHMVIPFAFLIILFLLKYISPFIFATNVDVKALVMDGKYMFYIIFVYLWLNEYKDVSLREIYRSILFFSKLYIVFTITRLFLLPNIDRDGILMESNYDGFMILLGLCLVDVVKGKRIDLFIMSFATFCTFSRTGIICLLILLSYKIVMKNIFQLIWAIPMLVLVIWVAISIRGDESVEHLDRFIFFEQAWVYFCETDMVNLLFGSPPGMSLNMTVIPEFEWYINHFEEGKKLVGIYPFYFHSTYLRLAFTWGVLVAISFLYFLFYKIVKSKLISVRYLYILVLIQSVSLSSLTIPNLSIMLFFTFALLIREEKIYCDLLNKKRNDYDSSKNSLLLVEQRPISG